MNRASALGRTRGNVALPLTPGTLYGNLVSEDGEWHEIGTPGGVVQEGQWQHVGLTYDHTNGIAKLYRNGLTVAAVTLGSFRVRTTGGLLLGLRPGMAAFSGTLDEVGLYNRALDETEIAALYAARAAGKCTDELPVPPILRPGNLGQGVCTLQF